MVIIIPIYDTLLRRWSFSELTSSIIPIVSHNLPRLSNRILFPYNYTNPTSGIDADLHEDSQGNIVTQIMMKRSFIMSDEDIYDISVRNMGVIINDPVNSLYTTPPNTNEAAYDEAKNTVGNRRTGLAQDVLHLGGTLNLEDIHNLAAINPTKVPLFPPNKNSVGQDINQVVQLITTPNGYKHYVKGKKTESGSATEINEATGFITFVRAASDTGLVKLVETSPISDSNRDSVTLPNIETQMSAQISSNLNAILTNGIFPADGEWGIVNIAQKIFLRINANGIFIERFSSDFASVLNKIGIDSNGNIEISKGNDKITIGVSDEIKIIATTHTVRVEADKVILDPGDKVEVI
jgi:hypothetical protein